MLVRLQPGDARPIYVQIMDEIRRALVVGDLAADEPLPSVRQLAGELRVHPKTILQAYRELERDGVVYVRRGQGTFAAPPRTPPAERRALAVAVAERALRDAHRHGLTAEELVVAVREAAGEGEGKIEAETPAEARSA